MKFVLVSPDQPGQQLAYDAEGTLTLWSAPSPNGARHGQTIAKNPLEILALVQLGIIRKEE